MIASFGVNKMINITSTTLTPTAVERVQAKCQVHLKFVYQEVLLPEFESYRLVPTASISSMKTIDGACSSATRNNSLTNFGPSPKYF